MQDFDLPDNLYFTKEHEWLRIEDNQVAVVGITEYAQDALGDIVYVEFPQEGANLQKEETFGVIESVKAVSDLYAPVTGEVVEVNDTLPDSPEVINDDPYGEAWMIKVKMNDKSELEDLLNADSYQAYVSEQKDDE